MITHKSCCLFFSVALILLLGNATAGEYIRVSPDLELYYVEAGTGDPLIFIPGWCGTTEFYMQYQIPHFSKSYRAISYDPRSHGRSSRTLENNNYTQHGADLKAFIDALALKDVILVAHSWGCHDVYAYFRAFGTENIKAFVAIDSSPKAIIEQEGDWGFIKAATELKESYYGIAYHRPKAMRDFFKLMVTRSPTKAEEIWFVDQLLMTPTSVALLLDYDGKLKDYSAEARMIDGKIPVLNVLSEWYEGWAESAQIWLAQNAPNSDIVVLGNHMMFFEFPNEFNGAVDKFLTKL